MVIIFERSELLVYPAVCNLGVPFDLHEAGDPSRPTRNQRDIWHVPLVGPVLHMQTLHDISSQQLISSRWCRSCDMSEMWNSRIIYE